MKTYFTEICEAATGKAFVTEETIWETIWGNVDKHAPMLFW